MQTARCYDSRVNGDKLLFSVFILIEPGSETPTYDEVLIIHIKGTVKNLQSKECAWKGHYKSTTPTTFCQNGCIAEFCNPFQK